MATRYFPYMGVKMATIIPFPVRVGPWPRNESTALEALRQTLEGEGLTTKFEAGLTDEGDPWAVFYGLDDGNALAHVARWRSGVILVWADGKVIRAPNLDGLVVALQRAIDRGETTLQSRR